MKFHLIRLAGIIMGGLAGYLYWDLYACTSGCAITSVWWRTVLIGGLMGYLLLDMAIDMVKKKEAKQPVSGD